MNITFLRNRFEILEEQEKDNINILLESEAKLDSPFSVGKFMIKCYCTGYTLNRIQTEEGLLLCVREDLLCTILNEHIFEKSMEIRRN